MSSKRRKSSHQNLTLYSMIKENEDRQWKEITQNYVETHDISGFQDKYGSMYTMGNLELERVNSNPSFGYKNPYISASSSPKNGNLGNPDLYWNKMQRTRSWGNVASLQKKYFHGIWGGVGAPGDGIDENDIIKKVYECKLYLSKIYDRIQNSSQFFTK